MKTPPNTTLDSDGIWRYHGPNGHVQRCVVVSCLTCGTEFVRLGGHAKRTDSYCSLRCYRKLCARCGQSFAPPTRRTMFCSYACKRGTETCQECGREFLPTKKSLGKFCSQRCHYDHVVPVGSTRVDQTGYVMVKVPPDTPGGRHPRHGNWMWEHRYVMQQKLGRALVKGENVHHLNGVRDDNQSENLELWKRKQPYGVRSADYHCPGCRCAEAASA